MLCVFPIHDLFNDMVIRPKPRSIELWVEQ